MQKHQKFFSTLATILCTFLALSPQLASGQTLKKIYEAPNLPNLIKEHKKVAIIPFDVIISVKKLPKGTTAEDLRNQEKVESLNIQNSMYTFFLKKIENYTIAFQDVAHTNAVLAKAGINSETIKEHTMDELAGILQVDAIISGTVITEKPISEGAAVAIALIAGVGTRTNMATVTLNIHNGSDATLLWRFQRELSGTIGSSADDLINILMRQVARNFPYEKP